MADKKEKRYVSDNDQLMAEWNWAKNNDITPSQFTCGSDRKVWWRCNSGHEWKATIGSRNRGSGCPFCAGKLVIKGENDLQTVNPSLAEEWDWEINDGLLPTDVLPNSHRKVWWKCQNGHSWQAAISKRSIGQGCPLCAGKTVKKGYNDLATTNPELVVEWDIKKNETSIYAYRPMSNKSAWWICDKGHSWNAVIAKRVNGEKCPVCLGKQILVGFNDLATTHPSLAQEWDYEKNEGISPTDVSKGSMAKVWWRCTRNHEWKAAVYSRTAGAGCPHCTKEIQSSFPEKAIFFYIKRLFPDAIENYQSDELGAFELDVFIPSLQIGIEYDGERWHSAVEKDLRKNKMVFEKGISLVRIREPACPVILDNHSINIIRESKKSGLDKTIFQLFVEIFEIIGVDYEVNIDLEKDCAAILELLNPLEKENSIRIKKPNLLNEWDYEKNGTIQPSALTIGSDRKVWWICLLGHSYFASISSRVRGTGCPVCSGKKVLLGYNDLQSCLPSVASEWNYEKNGDLKPSEVTCGSGKRVWWICNRGHEWQAAIYNRSSAHECPQCAKEKRRNLISKHIP